MVGADGFTLSYEKIDFCFLQLHLLSYFNEGDSYVIVEEFFLWVLACPHPYYRVCVIRI